MIRKTCPTCCGTGNLPEWPSPYTPLPAGVISAIKERAPKCGTCEGKGYLYEEAIDEESN